MTILDIIIAIYILGVFFNFGTIFEDAMYNDRTAKEICEILALSLLSWILWPILYTYQSIVKKQERKKLGI